jgi:hypothetical protein
VAYIKIKLLSSQDMGRKKIVQAWFWHYLPIFIWKLKPAEFPGPVRFNYGNLLSGVGPEN